VRQLKRSEYRTIREVDMRTFRGTHHAWILALLVVAWNGADATDGHQLIGIGAVQKSTAGAGVASPKDSTWALLNPAGIALLDRRADLSVELFAPDRSIEPAGPGLSALGGASLANNSAGRSSDDSVFIIPSLGMVSPIGKGACGIGLYGVSGMGVDYANPRTTIPAMSGESYDRRTEYAVAKLALAYAVPVAAGVYAGGALNGDYARFRSDMLTATYQQTKGAFRWDESLGGGFQVGLLKKWEKIALGGTYISRQWVQTMDLYDDLLSESLDLPQMVQVGVAWDVLPAVELLADYKYINWSGVPQLGNAPAEGGFGWEDQNVVKLGVRWQAGDALVLSAGYSHGNSPIEEDVVFANALFPAIVEDHVTAGVGLSLSDSMQLQVTYMHAFENTLRDNGQGDMYSQAGAGTEISLEEDSFALELAGSF
jgi:long-chain fatty acid transport protein